MQSQFHLNNESVLNAIQKIENENDRFLKSGNAGKTFEEIKIDS